MNNYISEYNIDIHNLFTTEDIQNELYDKVFIPLNFNPEMFPSEIERLECLSPQLWNSINNQLEELEERNEMNCYFHNKDLLERDLNKTIGAYLKLINFVQKS